MKLLYFQFQIERNKYYEITIPSMPPMVGLVINVDIFANICELVEKETGTQHCIDLDKAVAMTIREIPRVESVKSENDLDLDALNE